MHACDRKGFINNKITKNTYICSLHFIGGDGLNWIGSINASLLQFGLVRKKDKKKGKRHLEIDPLLTKKEKG